MKTLIALIVFGLVYGCGFYTFKATSLPPHLKSVDIPLLVNQSMEPDVADEITRELNRQILIDNLLRIVTTEGDATIRGTVTSYVHEPYAYGASSTRQVDVKLYVVKIVADVEFYDNVKDAPIFKEAVTGQGIYDFDKQTEDDGRKKAVLDIVQRIIQNSMQGW